jgi:uncharacterized protein (DUF488 family)
MTPRIAFTVGYQGADPDVLVVALAAAGVTSVVDVRHTPTSRRPGFRREALKKRLASAGVAYVSRPSLGLPKRYRALASTRRWLFEAAYRGVLGRGWSDFEETVRMTTTDRVALLCFEIDPGACHRGLLATAMSAEAPILFSHLRPGGREDADDHPVAKAMVSPHDQVKIPTR